MQTKLLVHSLLLGILKEQQNIIDQLRARLGQLEEAIQACGTKAQDKTSPVGMFVNQEVVM